MSITSAREYAQSIVDSINARMDAGYPFGLYHDYEGWADVDNLEALESANNDPGSEWREATAHDYLEDILDINYLVRADRTYKAARILLAFGGPTAWLDTNTCTVDAAWWSETVHVDVPREYCELLDDALEVFFDC